MRSFRYFFPNWLRLSKEKTRRSEDSSLQLRASPPWRTLYIAALFENDNGRKRHRIVEAKDALVTRARELFHSKGNHVQEQSAIDDALHVLQLLERCKVDLRP